MMDYFKTYFIKISFPFDPARLTVSLILTVVLAGTVAHGQTIKSDTLFKRNKIYKITFHDSIGSVISEYFPFRDKHVYYKDGKKKSIIKNAIFRSKKKGHIYITWDSKGKKHRRFERAKQHRDSTLTPRQERKLKRALKKKHRHNPNKDTFKR